MAGRLSLGIRVRADAWANVAGSRDLRRAHLSFGAMWAAEAAFMVALGVVAFRDGGAAAVGAVTAVRMASAALLAPVAATVADRLRRERVLATVGVVRAATLGGIAAVVATSGSLTAVYAMAVVAAVALSLFRPAHSALLPALAASPQELTSANAVRGGLDSLATLGGPLLAAALLAASGPGAVFAVCAAGSLWAGLLVAWLAYDAPPRAPAAASGRGALRGFATIAASRDLLLMTALGTAQTFTRGCVNVLIVVLAIQVLDTGDAGVGVLTAAMGAGGVLGSILAFRLVRRGGLAAWFGVGVALWGAPLAVVGVVPEHATALVMLGLLGVGNALVDVGAFTLTARLADETVLARMFASFEAVLTLGVAAGGLVTPLLVELLGIRAALVAVGLVAPLAVAAGWRALRRLDAAMRVRDADIELLRAVPMLRALPAATIEQLGAVLEHTALEPGATVFEQGDPGDRFYVIEDGHAEVVRDGVLSRVLHRGDGFGEIALLRDSARTATVRASADRGLRLSALPRSPFLTAVTGYPSSAGTGEDLVSTRLREDAVRASTAAAASGGAGERADRRAP